MERHESYIRSGPNGSVPILDTSHSRLRATGPKRGMVGENPHPRVLTDDMVIAFRGAYVGGKSIYAIAKELGRNAGAVWQMIAGEIYVEPTRPMTPEQRDLWNLMRDAAAAERQRRSQERERLGGGRARKIVTVGQ